MIFEHPPRDGQPKATASDARVLTAIELLEHLVPLIEGDSRPLVPYLNLDDVEFLRGRNRQRAPLGRVLDGVVDDVVERLQQRRPVGANRREIG